jgi:hypothetical protein
MKTKKAVILLSLFAVSLSLFLYQVVLTRIYSAVLLHHYVFLTTSFAVLGLGIGSVLAYFDKKTVEPTRLTPDLVKYGYTETDLDRAIVRACARSFLLSLGFIIVFILIYVQPFIDSLFVYTALGIIPFIIAGYLYALLFKSFALISGKLYFFDLIGAGLASIAIIPLLDNLGMFRTVALICLLPLFAAVILYLAGKDAIILAYTSKSPTNYRKSAVNSARPSKHHKRGLRAAKCVMCALGITAVFLLAGLFLPRYTVNSIEANFYALLNNDGKTHGHMRQTGLNPEIVFSRWDSFARTDLIRSELLPQVKFLTIDGAANAPMYAFDGNIESLHVFDLNTGFIPFVIGENQRSLIIGAGGGRGILYALYAGSTEITAVEINAASIEAARAFGDFNGHIFDRPEVFTHIGDGRNYVRTTANLYDVIFLQLVVTSTAQGAGFALSENFIHTVEAARDYLDALNPGGRVVFVTHDQVSLDRLITTAIAALVSRGVALEDTPDHIAVFYHLDGVDTGALRMIAPVLIVKNEPFTQAESAALMSEISRIESLPLYVPYFHVHGSLRRLGLGELSVEELIDTSHMRAAPVSDNSPYFFNFERAVPSVLILLLIFGFISSLLLFIPCIRKKQNVKPSVYFGLLGLGFMLIQIPLTQIFILYLGHPTPAFSFTLAAMLIGCGIGGYFSGRVQHRERQLLSVGYLEKDSSLPDAVHPGKQFRRPLIKIYFPPLLAAAVVVIMLSSVESILQMTSGFSFAGKVIIVSIISAVPGFFMGMPFPRGLSLLGESGRKDIIPIMWGINGTMAVAGSALSIILSMTFGFTAAFVCGAAVYVIIAFLKEI